jgi:hypothetical protein
LALLFDFSCRGLDTEEGTPSNRFSRPPINDYLTRKTVKP